MIGLYFSGTGNTRYCLTYFLRLLDESAQAYALEEAAAEAALGEQETIVLAYPVYFSNVPKLVRDFLAQHQADFGGKRVFILATMGLWSGDGAGCAARLLRRYGAEIAGGLHVKMPDCIADERALKRPLAKNQQLIAQAEAKMTQAAQGWQAGRPPQEGLGPSYHLAGLLGQRLWFYGKTLHYSDKLKIDPERCMGCGRCISLCPLHNLSLAQGKAAAHERCTMCYRCVNACPQQAITLLGKRIGEQGTIEKYLP